LEHARFSDLPRFLRESDILFRNNAAVLPARLEATRATGGKVECLLLRPTTQPDEWTCLVRPGKKLAVGAMFSRPGEFAGEIVAKNHDATVLVRFKTNLGTSIVDIANRIGHVPLPPYIHRSGTASERAEDLQRYQTVYADPRRQVAAAAPTAGLHFTTELLDGLRAAGISTADVTLHVGLGTFKPISADTIEAHEIHRETYELPLSTQQKLLAPTGRRVAVGTTCVRAIEDFLSQGISSPLENFTTDTSIFIYPPRSFRGTDALITNFHQPRSTLLCLVAAFLTPGGSEGISWLKEIYAEAIAEKYRFFSYGDAMLIV
jgi:S-adenosylmethionine:tRNA ribosyltransferase-isomerase